MPPHRSWIERRRIHQRAKQKLGLPFDPGEHFSFMQQCVPEMMNEGGDALDAFEAQAICQLLWEEEQQALIDWADFY